MSHPSSAGWAVVKCEDVLNDPIDSEPSAHPSGPLAFMRRRWVALLVIVIALGSIVALIAYLRHEQALSATAAARGGPNVPVAVSVATVTSGDIQLRIPALGTVTPLATVTVRTQISGVLQRILFTEGQIVRQGDSLAQIDPRPYEAALQQAQGNLNVRGDFGGDVNGRSVHGQGDGH